MGKIRILARMTALLTMGSVIALNMNFLEAATDPGSSAQYGSAGFIPSQIFQAATPPSWDASQGQMMATIMSSCQAPITTSIAGISSAMTGAMMGGRNQTQMAPSCPQSMGVSIETVCPVGDSVMDTSMVSCENYNEQLVESLKFQLNSSFCAAACKSAKLTAIRQEISCIQGLASNLNNQAKSVGEIFNQNILKMQAQVQAYNSTINDRMAMIEDVTNRLQGDKTSGATGLLKLKEDTDRMLAAMPAEIQAVRQKQQTVTQWQKSLDGQIRLKKMSDAMKCFNTQTFSGYKCSTNDTKSHSAKDALLCQFQSSTQVDATTGRVERNQTVAAQGASQAEALRAVLEQMTLEAPTDAKIPTTQQDLVNNSQQSRVVLTVADVKSRYYQRLSQFKIGNTNAGDIVVGTLNYCYNTATKSVARDQQDANSLIGQANFNINTEKQNILDSMKPLYQKYNTQYTDNMRALTGANYPLNTTACTNAAADTQVKCLEDIRKNLTGLYSGTSANSTMTFQVKGVAANSTLSFTCQGLSGCVTNLQNVSRNLTIDKKKLENDKKNYVSTANKSVQDYAMTVSKMLSGPSQMLRMKIDSLSNAVRELGGQMPNATTTMKPEAPQFDQEGLMKPPTNPLAFIGSNVTPALPEMNALSVSLPGNIDSVPRLQAELMKISTLKDTCTAQRNRGILDNVINLSTSAQDCSSSRHCEPDKAAQTIQTLTAAVNRLQGTPGVTPQSLASLQTGVQTFCPEHGTGQTPNQTQYGGYGYSTPGSCAAFYSTLISADRMLSPAAGASTTRPGSMRAF